MLSLEAGVCLLLLVDLQLELVYSSLQALARSALLVLVLVLAPTGRPALDRLAVQVLAHVLGQHLDGLVGDRLATCP